VNSAAKRQVAARLLLAVCAYSVLAGLAVLSFWRHGSTTVTVTHAITGGSTYITQVVRPNNSVYQENPGPVTVILLLMLVQ
jgi:diphthamide biosynthesis methyltransferase